MPRDEKGLRRALRSPVTFTVLAAASLVLAGSPAGAEQRQVVAVRLAQAPVIDGSLDDPTWQAASVTSGFLQIEPEFGVPSPFRTEVLVGFDDAAMYFGFRCYDPDPERISAAVTTRDGPVFKDDAVAVMLDPFDDNSSGYFFRLNLLGTQTEGRLADNGNSVDDRWDAAWPSAARRTDYGWSAELAIPFAILKYPLGSKQPWGVNFVRTVPRRLEQSAWSGPGEKQWRVSAFGVLLGLEPPQAIAKRYELIPYVLGSAGPNVDERIDGGADLRYRLSSTVTAEATINPDFALIEADVEQINLSRFELFIPEKRPFFLEGGERFNQRIRQFYSRRIGDIPWGAKLSGTANGWDFYGLAAAADAPNGGVNDSQATYGVTRIAHSFERGSSVGLIATNRRLDGVDAGSVGVDSTLFFTDTLGMTAQYIAVHGPGDGRLAWFIRPAYDSATTHFHVRYSHLDTGIRNDLNAVGFLSDDNRRELDSELTHIVQLKGRVFEQLSGGINFNRYTGQDGVLRSRQTDADLKATLTSGWFVLLSHTDEFKRFERDFDNRITTFEVGYDSRRGNVGTLAYAEGRNFDRDLRLLSGSLTVKLSDRWSLSYQGTDARFCPDGEGETTTIHVLRSDYYFTNDLFLKLFFQTNTAIDKDNVQALVVWRFKPPFGALQVAYQRGTSVSGTASTQDDTFFTKLSWVF